MCLSFVPPCIMTCIANEDKRDDKQRSSFLFLHTFPTQHAYLSAITVVNVCYERGADISVYVSVAVYKSTRNRPMLSEGSSQDKADIR